MAARSLKESVQVSPLEGRLAERSSVRSTRSHQGLRRDPVEGQCTSSGPAVNVGARMAKKRKLTPPNWDALTGGGGEDKWQEDRLRKFGSIKAWAPAIAQLQDHLLAEGALY